MSAAPTVSQVVTDLIFLAEAADRVGQSFVHGAAYAAALMLVDAAAEDGVHVDVEGFFGSLEG